MASILKTSPKIRKIADHSTHKYELVIMYETLHLLQIKLVAHALISL